VIVRELNKINITHNGRTITVPFAMFSFEVVNDKLIIFNGQEIALVLPTDKELINQAYAAINIKGKQGERGIQGNKGDEGNEGKAGKDGTNGIDGTNGKDGETGEQGAKGNDGINGLNGSDGINGTNGQRGEVGVNGSNGKAGRNGSNGNNGIDGINGLNGQKGNNGSDGSNGVDGIGFNFKGDWQEITYSINDVVRLESVLFIAKVDTNNRPIFLDELNKDWEVYLLDGKNGRNGRDGIDGTDATDIKDLKVSSNDTTPEFLEDKIVAGTDITLSVINEGGSEKIRITNTASGGGGSNFADIWAVSTLINC